MTDWLVTRDAWPLGRVQRPPKPEVDVHPSLPEPQPTGSRQVADRHRIHASEKSLVKLLTPLIFSVVACQLCR